MPSLVLIHQKEREIVPGFHCDSNREWEPHNGLLWQVKPSETHTWLFCCIKQTGRPREVGNTEQGQERTSQMWVSSRLLRQYPFLQVFHSPRTILQWPINIFKAQVHTPGSWPAPKVTIQWPIPFLPVLALRCQQCSCKLLSWVSWVHQTQHWPRLNPPWGPLWPNPWGITGSPCSLAVDVTSGHSKALGRFKMDFFLFLQFLKRKRELWQTASTVL